MPAKASDKWIPWYFVLFFVFLTILFAWFIYIAIKTDNGVVTTEAYEKGLAYNQIIEKAKNQKALGWDSNINAEKTDSGSTRIIFTLNGADKKPITNAQVRAFIVRPTQKGFDSDVDLKESSSGGYMVEVKLPMDGLWEIGISATHNGQSYQTSRRVVIK